MTENILYAPKLNPFCFFADRRTADESFISRYYPYDVTNYQFTSYGDYELEIYAEMIDAKGAHIKDLDMVHDVLDAKNHFYTMTVQMYVPEDIHYIRVRYRPVTSQIYKVLYSNRICISVSGKELCLISYYNSYNTQDILFGNAKQFALRVAGGFGMKSYSPKSQDTIYQNQTTKWELLHSDPHDTRTVKLGGKRGIPDELHSIINRAFSCDRLFVNGKRYVKYQDATWEVFEIDDYPYRTWSIEMVEADEENEIPVNFVYDASWVDYLCRNFDTVERMDTETSFEERGRFTCSATGYDGTLYFGTAADGLYQLKNNEIQKTEYDNLSIYSSGVDADGMIYFGGEKLWRLRYDIQVGGTDETPAGNWMEEIQLPYPASADPPLAIYAIKTAPNGDLYVISSYDFIFRRKQGETEFEGLAIREARHIEFSDGRVYVGVGYPGNETGIYRLDGDLFTKIGDTGEINGMGMSHNGYIYVCCVDGIYYIKNDELVKISDIFTYCIGTFNGNTYFGGQSILRLSGESGVTEIESDGASGLTYLFFVYRDTLYGAGTVIKRITSPERAETVYSTTGPYVMDTQTYGEKAGMMYVPDFGYSGFCKITRTLDGTAYARFLRIGKYIDNMPVEGYPKLYDVCMQFTLQAHVFEYIYPGDLMFVSADDLTERYHAFLTFIKETEGDIDPENELVIRTDSCKNTYVYEFYAGANEINFENTGGIFDINIFSEKAVPGQESTPVPFGISPVENVEAVMLQSGIRVVVPDNDDFIDETIVLTQDESNRQISVKVTKKGVTYIFHIPDSVNIPSYAGYVDIPVESSANGLYTDYSFDTQTEWISHIEKHNDHVRVYVDPNNSEDIRPGSIVFNQNSTGNSVTCSLWQHNIGEVRIAGTDKTDDEFISMGKSRDGRLFFGSRSTGIWYLDFDYTIKQTNIKPTEGSTLWVMCFGNDAQGNLYAGMAGTDGVLMLNEETFEFSPVPSDAPMDPVNAIGVSRFGILYACTNSGVKYLNTDNVLKQTNMDTEYFRSIVVLGNNTYFGTDSTIYYLNENGLIVPTDRTNDRIFFGLEYGGGMYLAGQSGLYRCDSPDQIQIISYEAFLCAGIMNGKMYLGGSSGIWVYDGTAVSRSNKQDGIFYSCMVSENGILFFGGNQGIWYLNPESPETTPEIIPTNRTDVEITATGLSWTGIVYFGGKGIFKEYEEDILTYSGDTLMLDGEPLTIIY